MPKIVYENPTSSIFIDNAMVYVSIVYLAPPQPRSVRSIEGFRRWAVDGERFLTPVEETLPLLSAIGALYRSAKSGKREPVDDRYLEFVK